MARPHPLQPDPAPDGFWSSCDDEQPGVSIRPLSQADLTGLLAHLDHEQDHIPGSGGSAPVVAVRVRASVGRPGASAAAEYRRHRTAERARWTHGLPWRVAAVLGHGRNRRAAGRPTRSGFSWAAGGGGCGRARLAASVPSQPGHPGLAARGRR